MFSSRLRLLFVGIICFFDFTFAQERYELDSGWQMMRQDAVKQGGQEISSTAYKLKGWQKATVPGTVLTSLVANGDMPDPFWGMNNEKIPDIYETGSDFYTYWFAKDFKEEKPKEGQQVWLSFRGINYSCDVYLNGKKVNETPFKGMYLRRKFNITNLLSADGNNRLAVIVRPPDFVGEPNGGQGGDGQIAKNVGLQYTAGWDWIRPIRDRNTGIWDKVFIEKTGRVDLLNPHVVTLVPGKRMPQDKQQAPATLRVSAELVNASDQPISGILHYTLEGEDIKTRVRLEPKEKKTVQLPDFVLQNPQLWWPHQYGQQHLYHSQLKFIASDGELQDVEDVRFGVREIQTSWNERTRSKEIAVNGQPIFIKGGNWIISDAMLRFSDERYDAEIRFHRDMNLNLIRIWGGAITERPEFYEACDRYGLLVMQDFWISGDCNGRWEDPKKLEDQWTRRKYPDDHGLFLESAADMIKMVRNHPSLAIWCGGNEITPPEDILVSLRDSLLPQLDGTRWFVDYSNSNDMSFNFIGGNGDGPYGIQPVSVFYDERTYPFNSEVGSVGVGDIVSLRRFLDEENLAAPLWDSIVRKESWDSVWDYHTYIGYGEHVAPYGETADITDWAKKAQLVNYDQYRALMEGFSSHMWDWYTGTMIWKTQNPWTSMRGQMYDYYLDPNASLYGLRNGSEPVHAMYNPSNGFVTLINHQFEKQNNLMLLVKAFDMSGKETKLVQVFCYLEPSTVKPVLSLKKQIEELASEKGLFLQLQLLRENQSLVSQNFYWLPDSKGQYSGLQGLAQAKMRASAKKLNDESILLELINDGLGPVAFFNRVSLVDGKTGERILPTFYDDNYFSLSPGGKRSIKLHCAKDKWGAGAQVELEGWNVGKQLIEIK
ncbi:glycoside hydrolase family 2 protein [Olivibacter sitiensis]|uniref:glycoside hydrolase family 2 protein n=1 Tax=Olivibacter sitiensis TaxID=376470 RepID=UPI000488F1BC|nr:glycoside hydrolase family 2 TIM barrel-domain containing protein [Olivibacter sitiensis]